jgi:hypothetical protein
LVVMNILCGVQVVWLCKLEIRREILYLKW